MEKLDYLLLGAFIIFTIMVVNYFIILTKDGTECYQNPTQYMVKKLEQVSNTSVSCICSFYNPKYLPLYLTSNGTSVYQPLVEQPENYTPITINWSSLKFG